MAYIQLRGWVYISCVVWVWRTHELEHGLGPGPDLIQIEGFH